MGHFCSEPAINKASKIAEPNVPVDRKRPRQLNSTFGERNKMEIT